MILAMSVIGRRRRGAVWCRRAALHGTMTYLLGHAGLLRGRLLVRNSAGLLICVWRGAVLWRVTALHSAICFMNRFFSATVHCFGRRVTGLTSGL